jgi:hypothetical protein
MNRQKREAARQSAEQLRAQKMARKEYEASEAQKREEKIRQQIAKNNHKRKINEGEADWSPLLRTVAKKAPKLLEKDYIEAVKKLESLDCIRSPETWRPKGKGRETQFISLAEHMLAKYPTPKFLWSAFWYQAGDGRPLRVVKYVQRIARGDSFAKMCKDGEFPLPFTKKQCHMFLQSTAQYSFMSALRWVQVKTHGGSMTLHRTWMQQRFAQVLGTRADELFWDSVVAWFAKNPMLDLNQMGPLLDYIQYRRRGDRNFSMKGRSALAMLRGMEEWHNELQRVKEFKAHNYDTSGFKPGRYTVQKRLRTGHVTETWSVEEIRTSAELAAEGRAHSHCVYSYSGSIARGYVSIWSLKLNGSRMITIEVGNQNKVIRQARGKLNRETTAEEFRIIQRWAQENSLRVELFRW